MQYYTTLSFIDFVIVNAMSLHAALGVLAIIIGLTGYVPYFRNIFLGKTKPHAFSWLVWGVLTGIAFFGQLAGKGGAGSWVTGATALVCIAIFLLALDRGEKDFPKSDWLCLIGAGVALLFWALTNSSLIAIILITIIDFIGFLPTFRKSYYKPFDETVFTYVLSGLKFIVGILALQKYSIVTILYPASLVLTNGLFVCLAMIRRQKLKPSR
jgi:hypothetical protein